MALPLAGIAANMLIGAAIGGVGLLMGSGGGRNNNGNSAASRGSGGITAYGGGNNFLQNPQGYVNRPMANPAMFSGAALGNPMPPSVAQTVQVSQPAAASREPLARPETRAEQADRVAQEIQRLPVFTPTAPTLSTATYESTRRADVQKTKAGEQMLRNPLAIDRDQAAATIKSNLPTIGVSASGTSIANTSPSPIAKRGSR